MTLQDIIRTQAREPNDALVLIEEKQRDLTARQGAAEEQIKRSSTEITRQRALENERKRLATEAEERFKEAQRKLDEIDRQRQEVLERWTEKREAKEEAERLLKESRSDTDRAEALYRRETEKRDEEIAHLRQIETEKLQLESRLMEAYRRSVDVYFTDVEKRTQQALVSEEERNRRQIEAEAFKKARHEDHEIGNLCDQRDQFRELIRLATVPAVAEALKRELQRVELALDGRYPGALAIDEKVTPVMLVEELYFLSGTDGAFRVILPIGRQTWDEAAAGNVEHEVTCAMKIVWEMIKALNLSSEDGAFQIENGHCVFRAHSLTADDLATKGGFSLKLGNTNIAFRLSPLPAQIQEAMRHETTAS